MASWTWQTIVLLWIGALAMALFLVLIQLAFLYRRAVAKNTKFFWLLPYPGTVAGVFALTRAVARQLPLVAVALYAIPGLALALTLAWVLAG